MTADHVLEAVLKRVRSGTTQLAASQEESMFLVSCVALCAGTASGVLAGAMKLETCMLPDAEFSPPLTSRPGPSVQVAVHGAGKHLGSDVTWMFRFRGDGAFLEEVGAWAMAGFSGQLRGGHPPMA